jgi:NAD(P)-dependent dehydrogenase (short-subunit alcohol dehydrogenase family)
LHCRRYVAQDRRLEKAAAERVAPPAQQSACTAGERIGNVLLDLGHGLHVDERALGDARVQAIADLQHGLVQNAALLGSRTPIGHHDVAEWQRVLHVNLTAPFILCRCLLPLLLKSEDASIVFASSGVARRIRVNAVNPGPTRTAMRAAAYPAEDPGRLKTPEEILGAYLSLLGPDSRGVTGQSSDAQ